MHSRENRNGNRQSSSGNSLNPCRTPIPTCWDARPTAKAMLIDPVINSIDRDLQVLQSLGLTLVYTLDTHFHADHIAVARQLRGRVGSRIAGCLLSAKRKCATSAWVLAAHWWSSQLAWLSSTCLTLNLLTARCRKTVVAGSARKTCLNRCANIASRWPKARKAEPTRS